MNRNVVYRSDARNIVFNVYKAFLAESEENKLLSDLNDAYERTAKITGVSVRTVRHIVDEGVNNRGKFLTSGKHKQDRTTKQLDDFDLCTIRQKVQFLYSVQKELPTLRQLLEMVKKDLNFYGTPELLRQILISIGFKFMKYQPSMVLIEKPEIASKREFYLSKIIENRQLPEELQKNIIYVDEKYLYQSCKIAKCWRSIKVSSVHKEVSKEKRWIIMHAASKKGLVPNTLLIFSGKNKNEGYHSEMIAHNFTKWVTEKLVPNLTEASIIVMDNAPYRSIVTNEIPSSASGVDEIKLWLLENNISFDETLRKPSLLMLVKKHKPEPVYYIDELLEECGHTVVRLPPYHCDLNPIELIWSLLNKQISDQNVLGDDVVKLTKEAFKSLTVQEWENCFERIINIEKRYYSRESLYNDEGQLVITTGDESSSESEHEEIDQGCHSETESPDMWEIEYLDSDLDDL